MKITLSKDYPENFIENISNKLHIKDGFSKLENETASEHVARALKDYLLSWENMQKFSYIDFALSETKSQLEASINPALSGEIEITIE